MGLRRWIGNGWHSDEKERKRSGDDYNCETLKRGNVGDTGLILNELGSGIQGNTDLHDPSSTLRLLQEIKRMRWNK